MYLIYIKSDKQTNYRAIDKYLLRCREVEDAKLFKPESIKEVATFLKERGYSVKIIKYVPENKLYKSVYGIKL